MRRIRVKRREGDDYLVAEIDDVVFERGVGAKVGVILAAIRVLRVQLAGLRVRADTSLSRAIESIKLTWFTSFPLYLYVLDPQLTFF